MITISQLTRLPQRFRRYYDRRFLPLLERTGLSMREVHVLLFLANHPGQDTARDVAELRGLAKSQVSQAVEVLTGRGILARRADGEDRRIVHLDITEAGRPLAREAQAIQAACGRRLLAGLSEEEQAVFLDLLERVLRETEALT
ncbi:MarR family winged helix-turn-helix transcriptional regulator [uncultured Oscillibacter sp.]|uniref:MarR family winged helix-turn-helix transcriptional regulator n=1 Tax=uncultured Oscillibacter sp. TaxID=876091 RepID=UPI0025E6C4F5|nr:MarR family transcriptional regulator [uncultured Oscillibacter sp.]